MCEDDEVTDVDFQIGLSDSLLRRKVKVQSLLLKQFWTGWKREYFTSLREFHRTTGNNKQKIATGDVVLIHVSSMMKLQEYVGNLPSLRRSTREEMV